MSEKNLQVRDTQLMIIATSILGIPMAISSTSMRYLSSRGVRKLWPIREKWKNGERWKGVTVVPGNHTQNQRLYLPLSLFPSSLFDFHFQLFPILVSVKSSIYSTAACLIVLKHSTNVKKQTNKRGMRKITK